LELSHRSAPAPLPASPIANSAQPQVEERIHRLWRRGVELELLEQRGDARDIWIELLGLDPTHLGALHRLGALLAAAGENVLAREVFAEAVRRHPADAMSRVNLANVLLKLQSGRDQLAASRRHLEQALKIDPGFRPAHAGLAFVLARLDQPELAATHGRIAFARSCVVEEKFRGKGKPIRVLELIATCGGNVRIESFLSNRIFQRFLVAAEYYDAAMPLPEHDLVVNAVGDADLAGHALAAAAALIARSRAPVLNRPEAVLATGRAEVAARLSVIPGVRTARTATVSRDALAAPDAQATLARLGLQFPLLLRSPGFHGGDHFLKLDSPDDLADALQELPGRELLAIEYLDAFRADGKARKYRVMMVDGRLYPLHCAVSHHWKIHYFSAEMAEFPEHRAEDAAFLANMAGVLGPSAMQALKAIQTALGLDYGGIDFSIDRDGVLLVFEANATMVILPPGTDRRWDYRRPAVNRVCRAVHTMLARRAPAKSIASEDKTIRANRLERKRADQTIDVRHIVIDRG
jgi:tetratricopeptide (TPR) repeat protein